jgi:hypothetical protein
MIQSICLQTEDRAPVETDSSAVASPVTGQRLTQLCSFASALSLEKKCDKLNADLPGRVSGAKGQAPPVLHSMAGVLTSRRDVSP